MSFQKPFFAAAAILLVVSFLGVYGHAAVDDHGAEEVCQICAFLQSGAPVGVVFSILVFLLSRVVHDFVFPLHVVSFPIATPGRSPPIF